MVTLLQRTAPNTIAETKDRAKAIYFQIDNGSLRPIDELEDEMMVDNNTQIVVQNIPASNKVEPLGLPTMNFEDEEEVTGNEQANADGVTPLGLPVMNFEPPGKKDKKLAKQTTNQYGIEPLGLLCMSF